MLVCQRGAVDAVRLLLDNGADINLVDDDGTTPLITVCWDSHVDAARLLLDNGADVNRANKKGTTPLFIACQEGYVNVARLLLDNGADVDWATEDGFTPLHAASQKCYVDVARLLLDNDADVNRANKKLGTTPLFLACENGYVDVARLLLDNGADVIAPHRYCFLFDRNMQDLRLFLTIAVSRRRYRIYKRNATASCLPASPVRFSRLYPTTIAPHRRCLDSPSLVATSDLSLSHSLY